MARVPGFNPGAVYGGAPGGDRIIDIIMRGGQQNSELISRGGDIWSNAIGQAGNAVAQGAQAYQADQTQKKVASAVSAGLEDPTVFQNAIQGLPGPARQQALKDFYAAQEHATIMAKNTQEIARNKTLDDKARAELQQQNYNSMAGITDGMVKYADGPDGGIAAGWTNLHILKSKGLDTSVYEEPFGKITQQWQAAQKSGDPEAMAAAVGQSSELLKKLDAQAKGLASPDYIASMRKAQADTLTPVPPGGLYDNQTKTIIGATPKAPKAPPALQHVETAKGIQAFNPENGTLGPVIAQGKPTKTGVATGLSDDRQARLTRILPETGDWESITNQTPTSDDETTRGGSRIALKEWAADTGVLIPDKKAKETAIVAKATKKDVAEAKALLADPEVASAIGRYSGTATDFAAGGWIPGAEPPAKVRQFRTMLNRIAAEERHRLYGSALTTTESKFANGFLPAITQPLGQVGTALDEFSEDIDRAMGARFGTRGTKGGKGGNDGAPANDRMGIR